MRRPGNLTIAGIGEILFDVFGNGREMLGGAPFNAAFHSHQLAAGLGLGQGVMVSCVGRDAAGERIRDSLRTSGMSTAYLAIDPARPTGRVSVFLADGEPGYEIEADSAWDYIERSPALDRLASTCDGVCFGSLAQRNPRSRDTIRAFVEQASGAVRLYDVNLRRNTISGEMGYNREIIDTSCRLATVIKANSAELFTVCGLLERPLSEERAGDALRHGMEFLLARYPVHAVVVTCGSRGLTMMTRSGEFSAEPVSMPPGPLYPVGAGDACSAGILFGMTQGWGHRDTVELANRMGRWVVSQPSATPPLPQSLLEFALDRPGGLSHKLNTI
jgi:fructokinase